MPFAAIIEIKTCAVISTLTHLFNEQTPTNFTMVFANDMLPTTYWFTLATNVKAPCGDGIYFYGFFIVQKTHTATEIFFFFFFFFWMFPCLANYLSSSSKVSMGLCSFLLFFFPGFWCAAEIYGVLWSFPSLWITGDCWYLFSRSKLREKQKQHTQNSVVAFTLHAFPHCRWDIAPPVATHRPSAWQDRSKCSSTSNHQICSMMLLRPL